jgi:hypothetical protein
LNGIRSFSALSSMGGRSEEIPYSWAQDTGKAQLKDTASFILLGLLLFENGFARQIEN